MSETNSVSVGGGTGCLGMIIAGVLSWLKWHLVLWVIVNGFFSWFYVIYWILMYTQVTNWIKGIMR